MILLLLLLLLIIIIITHTHPRPGLNVEEPRVASAVEVIDLLARAHPHGLVRVARHHRERTRSRNLHIKPDSSVVSLVIVTIVIIVMMIIIIIIISRVPIHMAWLPDTTANEPAPGICALSQIRQLSTS
jgi:biopolymer transport protein ExbD